MDVFRIVECTCNRQHTDRRGKKITDKFKECISNAKLNRDTFIYAKRKLCADHKYGAKQVAKKKKHAVEKKKGPVFTYLRKKG
jgi:hypothetical protein